MNSTQLKESIRDVVEQLLFDYSLPSTEIVMGMLHFCFREKLQSLDSEWVNTCIANSRQRVKKAQRFANPAK